MAWKCAVSLSNDFIFPAIFIRIYAVHVCDCERWRQKRISCDDNFALTRYKINWMSFEYYTHPECMWLRFCMRIFSHAPLFQLDTIDVTRANQTNHIWNLNGSEGGYRKHAYNFMQTNWSHTHLNAHSFEKKSCFFFLGCCLLLCIRWFRIHIIKSGWSNWI